jgi:Zn-dependent peptidase ImmA (M78 family)
MTQDILKRHDQYKVPVNPVAIAIGEGLKVYRARFKDESVAGIISRDGHGNPAIYVKSSDPPVRKRYTVAHELGHFFLHSDIEKFVDSRSNLYRHNGIDGEDRLREVQANLFAVSLLMPSELLRLARAECDDENILASQFEVSRVAMKIRLASLDLL